MIDTRRAPYAATRRIGRVSHLYRVHFADVRRELLFLSGLSFFVAFGITRVVTRLIQHDIGPIRSVKYKGLHIHHQVFGIVMLVCSGHASLHVSSVKRRDDRWLLRTNTIVYGVGCALTLDELALWLNMEDVYWKSPGREIIDAGIVVTALASIAAWGAPFFRAVGLEARQGLRQMAPGGAWRDLAGEAAGGAMLTGLANRRRSVRLVSMARQLLLGTGSRGA